MCVVMQGSIRATDGHLAHEAGPASECSAGEQAAGHRSGSPHGAVGGAAHHTAAQPFPGAFCCSVLCKRLALAATLHECMTRSCLQSCAQR